MGTNNFSPQSIYSFFVIEMVKKQQKQPLNPDTFLLPATSNNQSLRGLRDGATAEQYLWFCEHFMECVIPSAEWKLKSRNKKMSEYVTATLEAFAVLTYCNSFPVWNQRWNVQADNTGGAADSTSDDSDDFSAISGLTPKKGFRFTAESKGSKKYEGWNSEGMKCYNDLLTLVEQQRGRRGCTFEYDLLVALSTKRKKGRGSSDENQPPRVRNHMDELMRIVGV